MIVNPGIRRFLVSTIQRLFNSAAVELPLTHSAIPTRGSLTPTFTRATTETGQKWDDNGYLDFTALAGEIVFKGARRERNWIVAPTENWSSASWVKSNMAVSGTTLTAAAANALIYDTASLPMGVGKTAMGVITLSRVTGAGTVSVSTDGGATYTAVAVSGARVSVTTTGNSNGQFVIKIHTSGDSVVATYPQLNDITGETDQTTIRPYVSVGVESAPAYHGSMVDGVKCYDTDRLGNPIATSATYEAVTLNGVAGTYVSTPDSVAASITGDLTLEWIGGIYNYAIINTLVSKWNVASYLLRISATKKVLFQTIGTNPVNITTAASVPFNDGDDDVGVKVVVDADNGAGGSTTSVYTTVDGGANWTLLEAATITAGIMVISDTADAVMIGNYGALSGQQAGKTYSARIYSGTTLAVDFNASRYAGGTTLTGSTGETWTLNGSAVIHQTNYPIVGYVPWEARTNLCLQSNAFGTSGAPTAPWTENGGVLTCTQNVVGPDGSTSAWTFTDDSAAAIEGRAQAITLTAAAYTFSVFVKKTTGATVYPAIFSIVGTTFSGATIDTNSGVCTPWVSFDALTPAAGMSANCVSHNSSYWRASLTFTGTAASWTHLICPAIATSPTQSAFVGATVATLTGSAVFYGAMVNLGAFAGPYAPTTTIAVARNANLLTYTGADVALGNQGWVYAEITSAVAAGTQVAILDAVAAGAGMIPMLINAGNNFALLDTSISTRAFSAVATRPITVYTKCAATWGGTTCSGKYGSNAVASDAFTAGTLNKPIAIGVRADGSVSLNGGIRKIYIGYRKLSASELQAITS
jgi:hypothetical protein